MTEAIKIKLSDKYEPITAETIRTAKNYVLRRESTANGIADLIDGLLEDAAEMITMLCYQFNVDPTTFQISSHYDERLYELIANILDELEDEIMDLLLEYSMKCTESNKKRTLLLPWILALHNKNRNLQEIVEYRLWNFSRDLEAMIVALRMTDTERTKAIARIKSNLKSVYTIPEMKYAFAHSTQVKAQFIRSHGVKRGNVGNSNSEANNIERMAKMTVQQAWMHQQYENYKNNKDVQGYYYLRGSNFHCDFCQERVGFHPIEDVDNFPPVHFRCACYAVPVKIKI